MIRAICIVAAAVTVHVAIAVAAEPNHIPSKVDGETCIHSSNHRDPRRNEDCDFVQIIHTDCEPQPVGQPETDDPGKCVSGELLVRDKNNPSHLVPAKRFSR